MAHPYKGHADKSMKGKMRSMGGKMSGKLGNLDLSSNPYKGNVKGSMDSMQLAKQAGAAGQPDVPDMSGGAGYARGGRIGMTAGAESGEGRLQKAKKYPKP